MNIITITKGKTNLLQGNLYSYPELCKLLTEEKTQGGNQRKRQLKEWQRYFEYEYNSENKTFLIRKIYHTPLPPTKDKRKEGNNTKYRDYISVILQADLSVKPNQTDSYTYVQLFKLLGFADDFYFQKDTEKVCSILSPFHVTKQDINTFDYLFHKKCHSILLSSLRQLEKNQILKFHKELYVLDKGYHQPNIRLPSEFELDVINEIKENTLKTFSCNSEAEIIYKHKTIEYYSLLTREIKKRLKIKKHIQKITITNLGTTPNINFIDARQNLNKLLKNALYKQENKVNSNKLKQKVIIDYLIKTT